MPSATSRDFYANALGIPKASLSINELMLRFYRSASTLPANTGSLADNMYDYFRFKLGLTEPTYKSLNDVMRGYFKSIGVANQVQFEKGVLTQRRNLVLNPAMRVDLTGFSMNPAGGTYTQTREVAGGPVESNTWYKALSTVASTGSPISLPFSSIPNINPGDVISCSAKVISSYTGLTAIRLEPIFRSVSNTLLASPVVDSRAYGVADTWDIRSGVAAAAPALTVKADFQPVFSGPQAMPLGGYIGATAYLFEKAAAPGSYFDGNSAGARWEGTANNSASQLVTWSA